MIYLMIGMVFMNPLIYGLFGQSLWNMNENIKKSIDSFRALLY